MINKNNKNRKIIICVNIEILNIKPLCTSGHVSSEKRTGTTTMQSQYLKTMMKKCCGIPPYIDNKSIYKAYNYFNLICMHPWNY